MGSNTEDMRDILHEFVVDSKEMVEDCEPILVELEDEYDEEKINTIFRCFHSIKGGAGFLNLNNIQKLTHSAETLLDLFRKGKLTFVSEHLDIMVSVCDQITKILEEVDSDLNDDGFEEENQVIITEIDILIGGENSQPLPDIKTLEQLGIQLKNDIEVSESPIIEPTIESPPAAEIASPVEEEYEIDITQEMIDQFVQEAESGFEKIEEVLLIIEKFGFEQKLLDDAYRMIHSFKGNCGFLNFKDLEVISHRLETIFDGMKNKTIQTTEDNTSVMFHVLDILRSSVQGIVSGSSNSVQGKAAILSLMDGIIPVVLREGTSKPPVEISKQRDEGKEVSMKSEPEIVHQPLEKLPPDQPVKKSVSKTKKIDPVAQAKGNKPSKSSDEKAAPVKSLQTDIRVNLGKVDKVINLVGELMIVSQMITSNLHVDQDGETSSRNVSERDNKSSHQLNSLITELQDVAMSIRMVPLAGTFRKMVRLVRDLSKKSGKQVQFETRGEDTELDKTVVEQISDPLVHIVRNAIDHGIEAPDVREKAGKSPVGKLIIEAKYEGNEVWIDIIDDGKGLDKQKILAKGIERGLVTQEESRDWPDSKIHKLIFHPGFSTAEKITSVSGRGVGMDVVKQNIEKAKGYVDIKSVPGQGSTLGLRIPLTLAIIDGMLLRVGNAIYTAPLLAIRESIQIKPEQITIVDNKEVVLIREQLITVYRLHKLHNITPQYSKLEDGILIVVEYQDDVFGLLVDELLGQYQTVIKGLSEYLGKIPGISGCSILSNGDVSLILDMADLRREID